MTLPIVAIRPQPGCSETVEAGRTLGLRIEPCPLFEVRPRPWTIPAGPFDGLVLGSANAMRHGGALVDSLVDKPVYAVGESTAAAARERGFKIAQVGQGGLQSLLDALAGQRLRLLRLAGRERMALAPPTTVSIETATVYELIALPLLDSAADVLRRGSLVLLHSAAAARRFAAECDRLSIHRGDIRLAVLGPRIAGAAGVGWGALRAAAEPNEAALLALARDMWHDRLEG